MVKLIVCSGEEIDGNRNKLWKNADHIDPYVKGATNWDLTLPQKLPRHKYTHILLEYCPINVYYVYNEELYKKHLKQDILFRKTFWTNIFHLLKPSGQIRIEIAEKLFSALQRKPRGKTWISVFKNKLNEIHPVNVRRRGKAYIIRPKK